MAKYDDTSTCLPPPPPLERITHPRILSVSIQSPIAPVGASAISNPPNAFATNNTTAATTNDNSNIDENGKVNEDDHFAMRLSSFDKNSNRNENDNENNNGDHYGMWLSLFNNF